MAIGLRADHDPLDLGIGEEPVEDPLHSDNDLFGKENVIGVIESHRVSMLEGRAE